MTPHLLRYQGLAVDDYGVAIDALNLGHPRSGEFGSLTYDYKICTPFYPGRFVRGNLNFLRNRLNRTFYEFINFDCLNKNKRGGIS